MLISAWHLLLPVFLCSPKVYCDDATASVQLFLDQECSQADSSAFKAQLNICIVISSAAAVGVIFEGHNPYDSGFIFITSYFNPLCINDVTPTRLYPIVAFLATVPVALQPFKSTALPKKVPSQLRHSQPSLKPLPQQRYHVFEFSSHTITIASALPKTVSSSKTTPSTISGTPSSSTATALTAFGMPSFLTTTTQTLSEAQSPPATNEPIVSGSPLPFPTPAVVAAAIRAQCWGIMGRW